MGPAPKNKVGTPRPRIRSARCGLLREGGEVVALPGEKRPIRDIELGRHHRRQLLEGLVIKAPRRLFAITRDKGNGRSAGQQLGCRRAISLLNAHGNAHARAIGTLLHRHFWQPDLYTAAPTAVAAVLASARDTP